MADSRDDRRGLLRLALGLAAVAAVVLAALVVPPWVHALMPPWVWKRAALALLVAAPVAYGLVLATALVGVLVLGTAVYRGRAARRPRPLAARLLLLCVSALLAMAAAEVGAAALRDDPDRLEPMPTLPLTFPEEGPTGEIDVALVGESSAEGVPYEKWLNVGEIVLWQLRRALPGTTFRLESQAQAGLHLSQMHMRLTTLQRRPEVMIIYAGHNEFFSRYSASYSLPVYYLDDDPPTPGRRLLAWAAGLSPLCRLIDRTAEHIRIGLVPPKYAERRLVDVPAHSAEEAARRLADFGRRLEAMVAYCDRLDILPVLVIPPGNDAGFDPNRSVLEPETPRAEREAFAAAVRIARAAEATDPAGAERAYRDLLDRHPKFAEVHHRLGRLLLARGDREGAYRHFARSRDFDAMPIRCRAEFQDAYRAVAARHPRAILVDGPAVIHAASPDGQLGDEMFNDAMHPSFRGYVALAQAILDGLHDRGALGWSPEAPAAVVDPDACARHFGMDQARWEAIAAWGERFWRAFAYGRYDPSMRLDTSRRFGEARARLAAGRTPAEVRFPGIGSYPIPPADVAGAGPSPEPGMRPNAGRPDDRRSDAEPPPRRSAPSASRSPVESRGPFRARRPIRG